LSDTKRKILGAFKHVRRSFTAWQHSTVDYCSDFTLRIVEYFVNNMTENVNMDGPYYVRYREKLNSRLLEFWWSNGKKHNKI